MSEDIACVVEYIGHENRFEITFAVPPERLQATRAALNGPKPNITVSCETLDAVRIAQGILEGLAIGIVDEKTWGRCQSARPS